MEWLFILVGVLVVGGILLAIFWKPLRSAGREIVLEKAREMFLLQRERLELLFFEAAARSGKPRGLRWKDCNFESPYELARDVQTGELIALVPVTIQFEAIEGSDMEGLPAVGNLRMASAVFVFRKGMWQTIGKAMFNLSPQEVLDRFAGQYERITAA